MKHITYFLLIIIGMTVYSQMNMSKQSYLKTKELDYIFSPDKISINECFPKNSDFLWGVATASHQNEGNLNNNWTEWEKRNSLERSGICTNSWEYWENDLKRIKELGCQCYRFSIEWSRIMPVINTVSYSALNNYKNMILKMKEMSIVPIITLHHFTRPIWIDVLYSGIHNSDIIFEFEKYTKVVMEELGDLCNFWITFNEPILECLHGYIRGTRPPGFIGDFCKFELAIANVCEMHSRAYHIIHSYNENAKVSIAKNFSLFRCDNSYDYFKNIISRKIYDYYNHSILRALTCGELNLEFNLYVYTTGLKLKREEWKGTLDFIGLNHYNLSTVCISYNPVHPFDVIMSDKKLKYPVSDMGWDICGYSMYLSLIDLASYGLPIFITENGCADNTIDNKNRINFLKQCLKGLCMAEKEMNMTILGFCYWTLQDNFEWEDGYRPKFGLYTIDFDKLNKIIVKNRNNKNINQCSSKKKEIKYATLSKGGMLYRKIIHLWKSNKMYKLVKSNKKLLFQHLDDTMNDVSNINNSNMCYVLHKDKNE